MEYVVFRSGGKQYRGKIGDTIEVDRIPGVVNSNLSLSEVLLWVSGGQSEIGKPTIPGAKIKAKISDQKKGNKIRVAKFKAKARYRKVIGFRAHLTSLLIEEFEIPGVKGSIPASPVKKQTKIKKKII